MHLQKTAFQGIFPQAVLSNVGDQPLFLAEPYVCRIPSAISPQILEITYFEMLGFNTVIMKLNLLIYLN